MKGRLQKSGWVQGNQQAMLKSLDQQRQGEVTFSASMSSIISGAVSEKPGPGV